jgi:hypothetical protein
MLVFRALGPFGPHGPDLPSADQLIVLLDSAIKYSVEGGTARILARALPEEPGPRRFADHE